MLIIMSTQGFKRARTPAQREHRRHSILATTASMLEQMPVAEVSLNELSRRVGLAKSNVLNYFESREAILLELLDTEMEAWADELDRELVSVSAPQGQRVSLLSRTLATSMDQRPVMCDLIAAQTAVLERNISTDATLLHKRRIGATVARIGESVQRFLPELDSADAYEILSITLLMASAVWPQAHPTQAVLAAYECAPEIAGTQRTFTDALGTAINLATTGLLAQKAGWASR